MHIAVRGRVNMPIWKQFLILAALAALSYGGYAGYHHYAASGAAPAASGGPTTSRALVEVAVTERRTIRDLVEAVGTTRARQSVAIVPEASGRIVEMAISPGQQVAKDAVLVRLDDTIARADVAEARALLLERNRDQKRMLQLSGSNAVAESALEGAIARQAEARAELDRAEKRLSERIIRAPFAGVVGLSEVDLGARVDAGTLITRLDDLSVVEVEFSLPETLFARIRAGQELTATSAAFPGRDFAGRIDAVDSRIDPVARSFRTRAVIPNPEGILPAGMFMSLELTLSQSDYVVVPEEALSFQGAETFVFVIEEGTARRTVVTLGQRRDGVVAVLDGLAEGARVVIRGLHRVRNGAEVEILNPAETAAPIEGADS